MSAEIRTPNSVKLSGKHREQTVANVLEAWEKKNPAPAGAGIMPLLVLIAKECKKHGSFKRSQRIAEAISAKDLHLGLFHCKRGVLVRTVDEQGIEKSVEEYVIPAEIADKVGLHYVFPEDRADGGYYLSNIGPRYPDENRTTASGTVMSNRAFGVGIISDSTPMVQVVETSAAYAKYKEAREARKEWQAQREQLFNEVTDALDQFNTTKQLREHWPDIVDFLPAHVADPERAIQLPTVSVSKLNERLGLGK